MESLFQPTTTEHIGPSPRFSCRQSHYGGPRTVPRIFLCRSSGRRILRLFRERSMGSGRGAADRFPGAYGLIAVARKSVLVPELKAAISEGELSVNAARKIILCCPLRPKTF